MWSQIKVFRLCLGIPVFEQVRRDDDHQTIWLTEQADAKGQSHKRQWCGHGKVCSHRGCGKDKTIWRQRCRPAQQVGGSGYFVIATGFVPLPWKAYFIFQEEKVIARTMRAKPKAIGNRKGKVYPCHHVGTCVSLPPLQDSSRKGFSIFSLSLSPAREVFRLGLHQRTLWPLSFKGKGLGEGQGEEQRGNQNDDPSF